MLHKKCTLHSVAGNVAKHIASNIARMSDKMVPELATMELEGT